jgi:hypothetical protein
MAGEMGQEMYKEQGKYGDKDETGNSKVNKRKQELL